MLNGRFGDLVKNDAGQFGRFFADRLGDVVADGFSLTVLIGRDIDGFGLFGELLQFLDGGVGIPRDGVFGYKVAGLVIDSDAESAFGKVPDMSFRGNDLVVLAKETADSTCFCRRFDDNKIFHSILTLYKEFLAL